MEKKKPKNLRIPKILEVKGGGGWTKTDLVKKKKTKKPKILFEVKGGVSYKLKKAEIWKKIQIKKITLLVL